MQTAVIEYARDVLNMKDANSTEFDEKTNYPVIDIMAEQKNLEDKGGTMRLGAYPCKIKNGTLAEKLYGKELIFERHRHRYEFNSKFKNEFEKSGFIISGSSPDGKFAEIVELPESSMNFL